MRFLTTFPGRQGKGNTVGWAGRKKKLLDKLISPINTLPFFFSARYMFTVCYKIKEGCCLETIPVSASVVLLNVFGFADNNSCWMGLADEWNGIRTSRKRVTYCLGNPAAVSSFRHGTRALAGATDEEMFFLIDFNPTYCVDVAVECK